MLWMRCLCVDNHMHCEYGKRSHWDWSKVLFSSAGRSFAGVFPGSSLSVVVHIVGPATLAIHTSLPALWQICLLATTTTITEHIQNLISTVKISSQQLTPPSCITHLLNRSGCGKRRDGCWLHLLVARFLPRCRLVGVVHIIDAPCGGHRCIPVGRQTLFLWKQEEQSTNGCM